MFQLMDKHSISKYIDTLLSNTTVQASTVQTLLDSLAVGTQCVMYLLDMEEDPVFLGKQSAITKRLANIRKNLNPAKADRIMRNQ